MKFDKGDRYFDKGSFEYVEDPTIESAESGPLSQVWFDFLQNNKQNLVGFIYGK